jgi:hypothetical protein
MDDHSQQTGRLHFGKPMVRPLLLRSLPGLIGAGAAALLVFGGFQAAVPHTFPWILSAIAVMFVLFGVVPLVVAAFVLARMGRLGIATGDASVSVKVGKRWQTIDLRELVGVGVNRSVHANGPFVYPMISTSLLLVDRDGHRMNLAWPLVTERLVSQIRGHMGHGVTVTPLAATLLAE